MNASNPQTPIRARRDVYPELTRQVIGASYEVHNVLGRGFLEKVYENALLYELRHLGLDVDSQAPIPVDYKGRSVGLYFADLFIENKVIVEIKTGDTLNPVHEAQLLHYLKATGVEVGLLLNFASERVQVRRLARSK